MNGSKLINLADRMTTVANTEFVILAKKHGFEDLPASYGHILRELLTDGPLTMTELAERVNRTKPNLTVAIKKLEAQELVTRVQSRLDARQFDISITRKGRRIKPVLDEIETFVQVNFFKGLTSSEKEVLFELLKTVAANL
jgi:DNA-binding MarR family transcriptional regulator